MRQGKNQMYFAAHPRAKHDYQMIAYQVGTISLRFKTDAGVFAKRRVDYGSGVLIKGMPAVSFSPQGILDMGTGYGPLGLFAAKFWPEQTIDMVDINERALALAKENAQLNGIGNVRIFASDLYAQVPVSQKYGLIVSNPPIRAGKKIVNQILLGAGQHLVPDGVLLIVIQKKQGEPSARKLLRENYGNCQILQRDKGYYLLKVTNTSPKY